MNGTDFGRRRFIGRFLRAMLFLSIGSVITGCGGGEICGTGHAQPGTLEIDHFALGQADATLIIGPTGRTLLVDLGETNWERSAGAEQVGAAIKDRLGCRHLDYALVTHFHLDHVGFVGRGGLWHLVERQGFTIGRTLHRDIASFVGQDGGTLEAWRDYLDGAGRARLPPQIVVEGAGQIDLGPGVTFTVVGVDGHGALQAGDFSGDRNPPSENDYSVAAWLRFGRFDYFLGGDLSGALSPPGAGSRTHDIETGVARLLPDLDVYRVNHHGSESSSNGRFLAQTDPRVAIISVGTNNPYGHPHPATLRRLLERSTVYATADRLPASAVAVRAAGNVMVRTAGGDEYVVNDDVYAVKDPPRTDADGDGYFQEADPDDFNRAMVPLPLGGCDLAYQWCGTGPGSRGGTN